MITTCVIVVTCVLIGILLNNYMSPLKKKIKLLNFELASWRIRNAKQDNFLCSRFGNDYLRT
jgi:hypothetical protein